MNNLRATFLFSLITSLLVGVLISPPPAKAQFDPRISKVVIPFTFYAGDEKMPAGIYRVEDRFNNFIMLHGPNDRTVYVFVHDAISLKLQEAGTVVFYRYGETYFLKQIWYEENPSGIECYKSRAEKSILQTLNNRLPDRKTTLPLIPDGGSAGARKR